LRAPPPANAERLRSMAPPAGSMRPPAAPPETPGSAKLFLVVLAIAVIAMATLAGGYYGSARPSHVTDADSELTDQLLDEFKEAISEIQENYAGKVDLELFGRKSGGVLSRRNLRSQRASLCMRFPDLLFQGDNLFVQRAAPGGEESMFTREMTGCFRMPCDIAWRDEARLQRGLHFGAGAAHTCGA